ncbi:toprim domain-containing protein [Asticcacaulis sp. W401b]|uniref:DUF7146 domain-containing protein n=1 Tax=Asticcacaulis sp. W401b TaxID=3388666 RepID=UPI00397064D2
MEGKMSLRKIVQTAGGILYANGTKALIPAPGHSQTDRSASLMISRNGKVIVHSFGGATISEILADLRSRGLVNQQGYPSESFGTAVDVRSPLSDPARTRRALDLWSLGHRIHNTPAEAYVRGERAIRRPIEHISSLRYLSDCPLAVYDEACRRTARALLSRIETKDGSLCGIEITYLTASGCRNTNIRTSRKIVGTVPSGAMVALDPIAEHMVVGEGVMTVLSASEHLQLPGQALLSVTNLTRYIPPPAVRHLTIAADRGPVGEGGARSLLERLKLTLNSVEIVLPPAPYDDFNSWAQALKKEEGRAGKGDV